MTAVDKALQGFASHLGQGKGYSVYTVRNYVTAVRSFWDWCQEDGAAFSQGFRDSKTVRSFVIEKQHCWSRKTLHTAINGLRAFSEYWLKHHDPQPKRGQNPWMALTLPKLEKKLPSFMSERQMSRLLEAPMALFKSGKLKAFTAWRDRLILELLYGGGLRVSELVALRYQDKQPHVQALRIMGKGNKERIAPIGPIAWDCLVHFEEHYAPSCLPQAPIIVNHRGKAITPRAVQVLLKTYLAHAQIPYTLSPHKIRHSYATHLLNHGAPLPVLQTLLGHSSLASTQVYTHLDIQQLHSIHAASHPRQSTVTESQTPRNKCS